MKRKILLATFTFVTLFACAFGLSACGEKEHTHSYTSEVTTAATCTTAGVMTYTCSCGDSYTEAIPATGHTSVSANNSVAATCTTAGKESDTVCSVCKETLSTGAAIPALGHTPAEAVKENEKAATCTEDGLYDSVIYCSVCGAEISRETKTEKATGHNYEDGVCTVCGKKQYSEGLAYTLSDDGTFYIVSGIGTCTDTDIVIPSTYNGLPVTEIGDEAFYCDIGNGFSPFSSQITSVVIPNCVTTIGEGAFFGCTSLTSIVIPDGVTLIDEEAFAYCISLPNATIGNDVTKIGMEAFAECFSLTSVTIGKSVTEIGSHAFYDCMKLIEVYNLSSLNITAGSNNDGFVAYFANNVYTSTDTQSKLTTTSDGYIFYDDTANGNGYYLMGYTGTATSLSLPDTFNGNNYSIYPYAFVFCTSLTSIVIPDGVTSIGEYAFCDCTSLTSVTIGNGVTSIGIATFYECFSLTNIIIPDSVTEIGYGAFYGCYRLIEVYNLSSLNITAGSSDNGGVAEYAKNVYTASNGASKLTTTENGYIFYDDTENNNGYYLMGYKGTETALTLPDKYNGSNYSIYPYAFYKRTSLTNVTIPDGVTEIGEWAFSSCTSLTSVTIGNGVTEIGEYAFYYCTSLTSVTIGKSVTEIGYIEFSGCSSLTNITVDENNSYYKSIDGNLYSKDGTTLILYAIGKTDASFTIPNGVTSIGEWAFSRCKSLESITIPDGVTSIGDYAFYDCTSLTSVTIGNGVTEIGEWAFSSCTSLTSVTIGNGVTSIGEDAFAYCISLTSITIPDSVTHIGDWAFEYCTSLTYNEYDNAYYLGNDSNPYVILMTAKSTDITSCMINENTKVIYVAAFWGCTSLTSIVIPDGVTEIGNSAFYRCTSLTSVTIGNGVTEIGEEAFYLCYSLTSVIFKNTEGWKAERWNAGYTSISSADLADPATAAKYLISFYNYYYWKRS